jgi:hypothetical protein
MTIKIEKGVPLPQRRLPALQRYPFDQMAPGDSFAVEVEPGSTIERLRSNISACGHAWAKRNAPGAAMATRIEPGRTSVRIWLLTKPAPLLPISVATLPVTKSHRLGDDESDGNQRTTPKLDARENLPKKQSGGPRKGAGRPRKLATVGELQALKAKPARRERSDVEPVFAHDIPRFTDGAAAKRVVKGSRY